MTKFIKVVTTSLLILAIPAFSECITLVKDKNDSQNLNSDKEQFVTLCTAQGNFVFSKAKAHWANKEIRTKGKITYILKDSNE